MPPTNYSDPILTSAGSADASATRCRGGTEHYVVSPVVEISIRSTTVATETEAPRDRSRTLSDAPSPRMLQSVTLEMAHSVVNSCLPLCTPTALFSTVQGGEGSAWQQCAQYGIEYSKETISGRTSSVTISALADVFDPTTSLRIAWACFTTSPVLEAVAIRVYKPQDHGLDVTVVVDICCEHEQNNELSATYLCCHASVVDLHRLDQLELCIQDCQQICAPAEEASGCPLAQQANVTWHGQPLRVGLQKARSRQSSREIVEVSVTSESGQQRFFKQL